MKDKKTEFRQMDCVTGKKGCNQLNKTKLSAYEMDVIFNDWWLK